MTGTELLDRLERLLTEIRAAIVTSDDDGTLESVCCRADAVPVDTIAQLRALIRTDEETAALRAAYGWKRGIDAEIEREPEIIPALSDPTYALLRALDAIPEPRRAEIMSGLRTVSINGMTAQVDDKGRVFSLEPLGFPPKEGPRNG